MDHEIKLVTVQPPKIPNSSFNSVSYHVLFTKIGVLATGAGDKRLGTPDQTGTTNFRDFAGLFSCQDAPNSISPHKHSQTISINPVKHHSSHSSPFSPTNPCSPTITNHHPRPFSPAKSHHCLLARSSHSATFSKSSSSGMLPTRSPGASKPGNRQLTSDPNRIAMLSFIWKINRIAIIIAITYYIISIYLSIHPSIYLPIYIYIYFSLSLINVMLVSCRLQLTYCC